MQCGPLSSPEGLPDVPPPAVGSHDAAGAGLGSWCRACAQTFVQDLGFRAWDSGQHPCTHVRACRGANEHGCCSSCLLWYRANASSSWQPCAGCAATAVWKLSVIAVRMAEASAGKGSAWEVCSSSSSSSLGAKCHCYENVGGFCWQGLCMGSPSTGCPRPGSAAADCQQSMDRRHLCPGAGFTDCHCEARASGQVGPVRLATSQHPVVQVLPAEQLNIGLARACPAQTWALQPRFWQARWADSCLQSCIAAHAPI